MINRSYLSRRSCRNFDTSKPIPKEYIIIFCADFNRSVYAQEKNKQEVTIDGMSQFTINMVDVALAAAAASIHANTLGLGACFLGGLRSNADQLVKPLNIEGKCLPVLGLAIGWPLGINPLQPKVNKCYDEKYNLDLVKKEVDDYDNEMKDHYKIAYNKDNLTWTMNVAKNVNKMPKPDFVDFIIKNFIDK